ncbi:MAG: NAD-dependent epimerase/dehydratase family protein [Propionibacteriaceae bacterium]|nr:NAD-dependent epimerase/dehydratase family protein [Propionibacteriaceae bacterium]
MRTLFLGGPGNISLSTITELLQHGHEVAVLKRSRGGLLGLDSRIRVFHGDRDHLVTLTHVLATFRPDLVVDATCFEVGQAGTLIDALAAQPCQRVVFISTADVYGYPLSCLPMREDDPWAPPVGEYATNKLAIERLYQEAFRGGEPRLTIVRPGYALGRTFALTAMGIHQGGPLVARLRAGLPVLSPGDGTTLIDAGAAHNTGRMIAQICADPGTVDEAYTCAHPRAVTYDQYLQAFAEAVGKPAQIVHVPTDFLLSLDVPEVERSLLPTMMGHHLYFSVEKFARRFPGFTWDYSLADAARDFIAYQEAHGGLAEPGLPRFEDRVLAAWLQGLPALRRAARRG